MQKKIFINESTYALILLLISSFYFLFFYSGNAFEWPTNAELPIIARLQDSTFLLNDFYTNSAISSPKLIFSHFVVFLTKIGLDYNLILYLLKCCCGILTPSLIFLIYTRIAKKIFYKDVIKFLPSQIYFLIFIASLPFYGLIQGIAWITPFGWKAIQTFAEISPMKLSFFIGLIYLLVRFSEKEYKSGALILIASFLIHPVIGIFNYLIVIIFNISSHDLKKNKKILFFDFIFGIFVPLIFLLHVFNNESHLSDYEFYKIYVEQRHPHHYLVSEILNLFSVFWFILISLPLLLSLKIKSIKMITISSLIFVFIFLSVFLQYFFTEVYPIKFMMQLGLIRFTTYMSILWSINVILLITHLYFHDKNDYKTLKLVLLRSGLEKLLRIFNRFIFFIQESIIKKNIFNFLLIIIVSIPIFAYKEPLTASNDDRKNVIHWIKNNTNEDSIFLSKDLDSVFIRIYAERAIYADGIIPFSEKHFQEFSTKLNLYKKIKNKNIHKLLCKEEYDEIDFLITSSLNSFIKPVFISGNLHIYDANQVNCTNN